MALSLTVNFASARVCADGQHYDLRTNSCNHFECPIESSGSYPNCSCTEEHYVYNIYFNVCAVYCPANSTGSRPNCRCNDEHSNYLSDKNICEHRKCPPDDSTGIYPNCSCIHENFDYSADFNVCFRVCPENSTGYWPSCTCNADGPDGHVFDKNKFQCRSCPFDSVGTYPNCRCSNGSTYLKSCNACEACPALSDGVYPHCNCSDGHVFNALRNKCQPIKKKVHFAETDQSSDAVNAADCPTNTFGTFPKCTCENNGSYDYISQLCHTCDASEVYSLQLHRCVQCTGTDVFHPTYGVCVPEETQCPMGSEGLHPYCSCDNSSYNSVLRECDTCNGHYNKMLDECVQCTDGQYDESTGECTRCPLYATGIYPNCKCVDKHEIYDVLWNRCDLRCKGLQFRYSSKSKDCQSGFYDDNDEFICENMVGRKCADDSIGTGPYCLCIQQDQGFDQSTWSCKHEGPFFQHTVPPEPFEHIHGIDAILLKTMVG